MSHSEHIVFHVFGPVNLPNIDDKSPFVIFRKFMAEFLEVFGLINPLVLREELQCISGSMYLLIDGSQPVQDIEYSVSKSITLNLDTSYRGTLTLDYDLIP